MVSKRNRKRDAAEGGARRPFKSHVLLVVLAIVVTVLVMLLIFEVKAATKEGSGGPDAEWEAKLAPIAQLLNESETLFPTLSHSTHYLRVESFQTIWEQRYG